MANEDKVIETIPVGPLGLVPLKSCEELGKKVDAYLVRWRTARQSEHKSTIAFAEYQKDSYIIKTKLSRFGTGEGKAKILDSVRGVDLFILADVMNYSITYKVCGHENHMSPDNHFQDIKRIISAANGRAHRITVVMPFLYESRQHNRTSRESLDCALAIQDLANYGVSNIITFDAHDPRVMSAEPLRGFDNFMPTYQFLRALTKTAPDLNFDNRHFMVISPDEGAMNRAVYFSNILGADIGMFYKRRDYSRIVNGKNPIVAHEFLGDSVVGKDCVVIDDMIASGGSMLDVCRQIKARGAKRIFICATFGLFTEGFDKFDAAYEEGLFDYLITTNLCYTRPEAKTKPYFVTANMYKYMASIIDTLNHDISANQIKSTTGKITKMLRKMDSKES